MTNAEYLLSKKFPPVEGVSCTCGTATTLHAYNCAITDAARGQALRGRGAERSGEASCWCVMWGVNDSPHPLSRHASAKAGTAE